jgi:hypothetical protein
MTRTTPRPNNFVQYIVAGQCKAETTGEIYPAIELIAEGIFRLIRMTEGQKDFQKFKDNHRHVMQLLEKNVDAQYSYEKLIAAFAIKKEVPTKESWDAEWRSIVQKIAEVIAGQPLRNPETEIFMTWKNSSGNSESLPVARRSRDNFCRHSRGDKKVAIRIGSIHSVKGETHTATLVLETFWYKHNLEELLQWLDGRNSGAGANGVRQKERLRPHYVAMTRPTHLLCLAMKRNYFETDKNILNDEMVQKLSQHGWQIKLI